MIQKKPLIPIILLQFIPMLLFPPELLGGGAAVIGVVVVVFAILGIGLWRGFTWAHSLSMFMQGFNVIIRIMMLFPNAINVQGDTSTWDIPYVLTSLLAIAISSWFLMRLDRPSVRATLIA